MRVSSWATIAIGLTAATSAFAGHGHGRGHGYGHRAFGSTEYVYARVVDVEPLVRHVTVARPRQECWDEIVREPARPLAIAGPTVAGGVVGAAVGRQFGSGSGRDAMTLLGAVAGAAVANQRAVRNPANYATREVAVERCEVVHERMTDQVVDGYLVTYAYQGRHYTMRTDVPPGDRVRLAVEVRPVGYKRGRDDD
jgi:uncharacterized protein YcfJ